MHRFSLLVILLLLAGCVGAPQADPARYYVLSSLPEAQPTVACDPKLSLAIQRVVLPGYLETDRIITQNALNEMTLADFDLWAEPIGQGIEQTLAKNITALTGILNIQTYPWRLDVKGSSRLFVSIEDFYQSYQGPVILLAQWRIETPGRPSRFGEKCYSIPCERGADYEQIARAMSDALAALSQDIALDLAQ